MKYELLTLHHQLQILEQRLVEIEGEHYLCQLNRELLVAGGGQDPHTINAISSATDAITSLERAHEVLRKMLSEARRPSSVTE